MKEETQRQSSVSKLHQGIQLSLLLYFREHFSPKYPKTLHQISTALLKIVIFCSKCKQTNKQKSSCPGLSGNSLLSIFYVYVAAAASPCPCPCPCPSLLFRPLNFYFSSLKQWSSQRSPWTSRSASPGNSKSIGPTSVLQHQKAPGRAQHPGCVAPRGLCCRLTWECCLLGTLAATELPFSSRIPLAWEVAGKGQAERGDPGLPAPTSPSAGIAHNWLS